MPVLNFRFNSRGNVLGGEENRSGNCPVGYVWGGGANVRVDDLARVTRGAQPACLCLVSRVSETSDRKLEAHHARLSIVNRRSTSCCCCNFQPRLLTCLYSYVSKNTNDT